MKKVIKILVVLSVVAATLLMFVACEDNIENAVEINVAVPDGAPALAIAKLLNSSKFEGYKVNYEIVAGATEISAKITTGSADIVVAPTNIAAKLYSNGAKIKVVASNIFGLVYLVGTEEITSISALRGEEILCTGQGGTPDFVLQYVLNQNGINGDDANIKYISQGSDVIAALKTGQAKFALLGEPAATMAVNNAGARILVDFQKEWKTLTGNDGYPQASTIVTDEVFNEHSAFLKAFLAEMEANTEWVKSNVETVNQVLKDYGSTNTFASAEVIERCNVRYVGAMEAKASIVSYLEIMSSYNAGFIGATLPNDAFYAGVSLD